MSKAFQYDGHVHPDGGRMCGVARGARFAGAGPAREQEEARVHLLGRDRRAVLATEHQVELVVTRSEEQALGSLRRTMGPQGGDPPAVEGQDARATAGPAGAHALTWGIGVHPGVPAAQATYSALDFARLLPPFALVGEIGLDRRAGNLQGQVDTPTSVLRAAADEPVLFLLHSTGPASPLLDLLEQHPHPGRIMHWWSEDGPALERAVATGAFFTFNASSNPDLLNRPKAGRHDQDRDSPRRAVGPRRVGDAACALSEPLAACDPCALPRPT